jgi:putative NADH-flavin reductase
MKPKKIAVIGGTGKSGKYLVNRLIENRFRLKVLVRDLQNLKDVHPFVEIVEGDARDYNSISSLVSGCGAVISTLGQPKGESSIFSQATKNVVKAMTELRINRYIVTTGLNVDTPFDQKDQKAQFATNWMHENFPETTKIKQVEYDFLSKSEIEWTLVRLPLIVQTEEKFPFNVSIENCPGEKISSTDLADFLIAQLSDRSYIKKSPFLFNT